jgi:outer membrane protein assembly factor BamB
MAPALANGTVFVGSGDRSFYAIDAATGEKKWSYEAGGGMAATNNLSYPFPAAAVQDSTVFFVTEEGLHAVDAVTGRQRWLFETLQGLPARNGKRTPSGPVLGDGVLFLTAWPFGASGKGFLYAVDASSGEARWVTNVEGSFITTPVTADGLVFFAMADPSPRDPLLSDRATLYAVDAADGQVRWTFGAAREFRHHDLLVAGKVIYFSTDRSLSALELATGRQVWTFSAELEGPILADDQRLYVATDANSRRSRVRALALTTGTEQWSQRVNARLARVHDGVVYLSGDRVYALDTTTGKQMWSFRGTGREEVRLVSNGRLFLTAHSLADLGNDVVDEGALSALDARTGRLTPSR